MKAVIPAAGLGTRFLPATKNNPKEMLPLVDKPAIQYVVEEAVASGISDILIITGRAKRSIEDHFDRNFELEALLQANGDRPKLREVRKIADMADIHFVRQKETRGLGHAIWCARKYIGDEPFAVLLGDDIVFSEVPCTLQLMKQFDQHQVPMIAVERVARQRVDRYGIVRRGRRVAKGLYEIDDLVEKPAPSRAPSNLGILGRYILTPDVFASIKRTPPGKHGEVQLTDALRSLLPRRAMYAFAFEGKRYDLGDKLEWLKTNVEVALMRPEFRAPLRSFLRKVARHAA